MVDELDIETDDALDGEACPLVLELAVVGERCDKAVLEALFQRGIVCTRSQLARSFADGKVTRDGVALRPGANIREAMVVEVELVESKPLSAVAEPLPLAVVYEDDDVLVVDKPPGMAVHPGPGHPGGTLVNAVLHHLQGETLPVLPGNPEYRPGLVHRIDRDTSGLLVLARHVAAQEGLARQFREHTIERRYLALLRGVPAWEKRVFDTTHGRDPADRRRFAPVPHAGRRATTEFEVKATYEGAVLVRCRLRTGRTHQIRMHARHAGHPLLGDALYGRPPKDARVREVAEGLGRHALHAAVLGFVHPTTMRKLRFESPVPDDMTLAIEQLERDDS